MPEPVAPRDAATVLLLRDGPAGLQVYVLRRVSGMAFAGGVYAYPGGGVDVRDSEAAIGWAGPDAGHWGGRLGCAPDLARALVCAAVRETFEESGVLLAGPDADTVVGDVSSAEWEQRRKALESHDLAFGALLEQTGLVLRTDLLRPWARWITPVEEPRRFDARFFVAALPSGQSTRDISTEADRVAWARPPEVLDALARKEIRLMPPTRETMKAIARHDTVADVLDAADARDMAPVRPRIVTDAEGTRVLMPTDPGYDR